MQRTIIYSCNPATCLDYCVLQSAVPVLKCNPVCNVLLYCVVGSLYLMPRYQTLSSQSSTLHCSQQDLYLARADHASNIHTINNIVYLSYKIYKIMIYISSILCLTFYSLYSLCTASYLHRPVHTLGYSTCSASE